MFFDPIYLLFSLPAFLLAIFSQLLVKYYYNKYSSIGNKANLTGVDIVEKMVKKYDLNLKLNVSLEDLSDNYNPISKELTLSDRVAKLSSIASIGIAAHELGHALQHKKGMFFATIRSLMVPVVNFGTTLGYILFLLGIMLQFFQLAIVGVIFFSLSTIFVIITLPIEIDASFKAMNMIKGLNVFTTSEISGVNKVLVAAALTYIAAVAQSLTSLLYFIFRATGIKRRD